MNNTHPLKYVRIQGRETAYRTGKPVGIFAAVWRLEQTGVLTDDEKAIYHEIDDVWFQENLPNPPFYDDDKPGKPITWFKTSTSGFMIEKLQPLMDMLVVNDGGWCQATHLSIVAAMEKLGIPKENLLVIENVAEEQVAVENAYDALASEGVNLIIGASSGYATFLSDLAAQNPDIVVAQQGDKKANLIGYQIRNYEGMFLAGYASALMAGSDTLGFAASMSEASVRSAINGYALGAKYANPKAKVQLAWANSWYDVDLETQSAQTLINKGIKYMGMEASSPAIPQTCEAKGAYCIGYNVDMQALAPKAVLFSYIWNFEPIFKKIITSVADGTAGSDNYYYEGGECAAISAFNDAIVPKDIQTKVLQVKDDIANGKINIYGGELKDNKGNVLVPAGESMSDEKINTQEFLVENVMGEWK